MSDGRGYILLRRFRQCREAPKGSPESVAVQTGKDRSHFRPFFFPLALSQPWHPLRPRCARPPLPKGEARAWTKPLAPLGAAAVDGRVPSPRRALPLLGEVPSAHTGERGLRGRMRSRREKTGRTPPTKKLPTENPSAIQVYHYLTIRKLRVMGAAR